MHVGSAKDIRRTSAWRRQIRDVLVVFLILHPALASAQDPEPAAEPPAKPGADPTDFITRYEPSFEHKSMDGGSQLDLLTLRSDFALRPTASIRLDVPLVGYKASDDQTSAGFENGFSLGDVVVQLTLKPYSSEKMAVIYGLRLDLDTATLPEVGQGGTTYTPLGAVAFFLPHKTLFAPFFQWYRGSGLDNLPLAGERDINRLSVRPIYLWQPGKKQLAYLMIDPELIWDFETDDFTATLSVEYGKAIGRTQLLILKPTVGLTNGTTEWGFKFAFRHMFPGKYLF